MTIRVHCCFFTFCWTLYPLFWVLMTAATVLSWILNFMRYILTVPIPSRAEKYCWRFILHHFLFLLLLLLHISITSKLLIHNFSVFHRLQHQYHKMNHLEISVQNLQSLLTYIQIHSSLHRLGVSRKHDSIRPALLSSHKTVRKHEDNAEDQNL